MPTFIPTNTSFQETEITEPTTSPLKKLLIAAGVTTGVGATASPVLKSIYKHNILKNIGKTYGKEGGKYLDQVMNETIWSAYLDKILSYQERMKARKVLGNLKPKDLSLLKKQTLMTPLHRQIGESGERIIQEGQLYKQIITDLLEKTPARPFQNPFKLYTLLKGIRKNVSLDVAQRATNVGQREYQLLQKFLKNFKR